MGETAYAKCGDLSLAYQVFGDGPIDIVFASSFVSHIELQWATPEIKAFFDHLALFARVLIFDKAGVGLSDPVPKVRSIEDRGREILAVMDAAGFERAALMGLSEGGPASIVFAASRPDRVSALILMGTGAYMSADWSDIDAPPAELRERYAAILGPEYTPNEDQIARMQEFVRAIRDDWGTGKAMGLLVPHAPKAQRGMYERMTASPGMARATIEAAFHIDVRAILPTITQPTLVLHAVDDTLPIQSGRYIADHIPDAQMVELQSDDHAPWFAEPDRTMRIIEEFLTGTRATVQSRRALRTVLYTDMVSSTQRAASMGDERWHALLDRFDHLTRDAVGRCGGQLLKSMGDGHLSTLDGPAIAIQCAESIRAAATALEVDVRAGIHTGECELMGEDIGGLAVHIGARVIGHAEPGEILVSSTVRDLVVGSGLGFEDRGVHELKGVPGTWQLLSVRPGGAAAGSPEAMLAARPTPSPRDGMTRGDRAMGVVVRRAPGLLRGLARLTSRNGRKQVAASAS